MSEQLAHALKNLMARYIALGNMVNTSSSSVRWLPETDVEIIEAKEALKEYYKEKGYDKKL